MSCGGAAVVGTGPAPLPQPTAAATAAFPRRLAEAVRPLVPQLTDEIAAEIQRQVADYGPHSGPAYLASTRLAISQAVLHFVDQLTDPDVSRTDLDETLRRIGRGEAYEGRTLQSLRASFAIGAGLAARRIRALTEQHGLPLRIRADLNSRLASFMESLAHESALGYHEAQEQLSQAAHQWRAAVLELILAGAAAAPGELAAHADAGNWLVPDTVVLVAVRATPGTSLPSARQLHPRSLAALHAERPILLYPAAIARQARSELDALFAGHRVAIGCAVALADAATSLRWARRALELVDQHLIPDAPVLDCAEHISTLWIHAEPLLADIVRRTVLAPLFDEPPNSRRILAETLFVWIETRHGSAPALADLLGRHPQTVRYRLKRLREMFGDVLDDPERVMEMYLALRSSAPLWNDGRIAARPPTNRTPARTPHPTR